MEDVPSYRSQPGLIPMVDFEMANPYTPPPSRLQTLRLEDNSGIHASNFHVACQEKGLTPHFTFREPAQGAFIITLSIDGQKLDELGPYASKKDAKEAICKLCVARLGAFDNRKKRKSVSPETDAFAMVPATLNEENWTSTLLEYCQGNKLPQATYTESCTHPSRGPHFCTVRFPGSPITPFGSTTLGFKNKKDAKKAASMDAVLWLRGQGKLEEIGNDQSMTLDGTADPANPLPTFHDAMDVNSCGIAPQGSIGKQVQDLCLALGFSQPEFEIEPLAGAFCNLHARFLPRDVAREPRLAGPIAPVTNVFGKRVAKEECWRELLKILEAIRRSRMHAG
ncbi:unnamed protein product [Zymoseptoria tritici ST99CH_1E4]|uniref:DRBM domain-containing protein n=1 Tax=Zymoseptoria tritici ST99CH_1E4 TaxID=1276532 RepID=A0A2H1GAU2_ZYMTR|nr:unnamed protein product [Zymoseptoria tritici ST99CH_1E4]